MTHIDPTSDTSLGYVVPGDLTSTNAQSVLQEINACLDAPKNSGWTRFDLNLNQAKMVDSAGLNVLVGTLKRVQKLGRKMRILYTNQNIFRIFVFTRLDQHIDLVKS